MRTLRTCSALAVVTLAAISPLACADRDDSLSPRAVRAAGYDGASALVVEADLAVERLVVTIGGERTVEMKRDEKGGLAVGAIDAAPGTSVRLAFQGYDREGNLTHTGKGAMDVGKEGTPQQEFVLRAVPGADFAAVRIGSYRLALSQAEVVMDEKGEIAIEAMLLDARGTRLPLEEGDVRWERTGPKGDFGEPELLYRDYLLDIRWTLRDYPGNPKFCTVSSRTCAKLTVQPASNVVAVGTGSSFSCTLRVNGVVRCWGNNGFGQLGIDAAGTSWLTGITWKALSVGEYHSCGIDVAGTVFCWGKNDSGQLGDGTTSPFGTGSFSPTLVSGLSAPASAVSAGGSNTCALLTNGETWCWGDNLYGQLGNGTTLATPATLASAMPVLVGGGHVFTAISVGTAHACGLTGSGEAWCWGNNEYLGVGIPGAASEKCNVWTSQGFPPVTYSTPCATSPRQVMNAPAFDRIDAGYDATCALTPSGEGWCWGAAKFSPSVYSGDMYRPRTPTTQPKWRSLVAGSRFQCGRDDVEMVWCFGETGRGEGGAGSTTNTVIMLPTEIATKDAWSSLDAGSRHACAVRQGGTMVSCWGDNGAGQLGAVTPAGFSATPVNVTARF